MAEAIAEMVLPGTYIRCGQRADQRRRHLDRQHRDRRHGGARAAKRRPGDRELLRGARSVRSVRLVRRADCRRAPADPDAGARTGLRGRCEERVRRTDRERRSRRRKRGRARCRRQSGLHDHGRRPGFVGERHRLHRRQRGHRRRAGLEAHPHLRPRQGDVHRRRRRRRPGGARELDARNRRSRLERRPRLRHCRPGEEPHGWGRPSRRLVG